MSFCPVMMMMHPREIPQSMESIKAVVNIPRVWFKAYNEKAVMEAMNAFVAKTNYSHYIICSDDVVMYKESLDITLRFGAQCNSDVFTGYCNMHVEPTGAMSDLTNVQYEPVTLSSELGPLVHDYKHWGVLDVVRREPKLFRQYMAGMALTCYPRETLIRIPLSTYRSGFSSDHYMSYELHKAGVKIWTHPDAFLFHLRRGWTSLYDSWTVGKVEPVTIEELDINEHEVFSDEIKAKYKRHKDFSTTKTSVWACPPPTEWNG